MADDIQMVGEAVAVFAVGILVLAIVFRRALRAVR